MDLFDTTQTGLERALVGSSMRQQALASNIANADTPGYQRQDVDFQSALRAAWEGGQKTVSAVNPTIQTDSSGATQADGNTVDVDQESADESQNGLTYEALAQVIKSRLNILDSAIGRS